MAFTRHIRDLLDTNATGGSPINSSTSLKIVSKFIGAAKTYWYNNTFSAPFNGVAGTGTQAGWKAVYMMGDESGTAPNPYNTPSIANAFLGKFPDGHGVYAYDTYTTSGSAAHTSSLFGQSTTITYSNSGLRHLAHQVQFAKGTSTFTTGSFITGGTNLPGIQNQAGVGGGNLYVTSNIAFSNFRGLTKDVQQSNYIWGDNVSETIPTTGPISIGNAAVDPGGSGA